ncbi:MAG: hypothetical protein ACK5XN_30690, partial [Bacteroidota bacterium]
MTTLSDEIKFLMQNVIDIINNPHFLNCISFINSMSGYVDQNSIFRNSFTEASFEPIASLTSVTIQQMIQLIKQKNLLDLKLESTISTYNTSTNLFNDLFSYLGFNIAYSGLDVICRMLIDSQVEYNRIKSIVDINRTADETNFLNQYVTYQKSIETILVLILNITIVENFQNYLEDTSSEIFSMMMSNFLCKHVEDVQKDVLLVSKDVKDLNDLRNLKDLMGLKETFLSFKTEWDVFSKDFNDFKTDLDNKSKNTDKTLKSIDTNVSSLLGVFKSDIEEDGFQMKNLLFETTKLNNKINDLDIYGYVKIIYIASILF